jgi:hypothetical protein
MNAADIKPGIIVWRWAPIDKGARQYLVIAVDGGNAFLRYTGGKVAPHSMSATPQPPPNDDFWCTELHATEGEAIASQAAECRRYAKSLRSQADDADKRAEQRYRQAVKAGYRGPKP